MVKEDVSPFLHDFFHRIPSPSKIAHFIGIFGFSSTLVMDVYMMKRAVKVKGRV
jgi:hypothetical protein